MTARRDVPGWLTEHPRRQTDGRHLISDEPSVGKSKTPAIQDNLNSLLQTLHVQKKRLEAGLATEAKFTMLARTMEARKKETDETLEGKL